MIDQANPRRLDGWRDREVPSEPTKHTAGGGLGKNGLKLEGNTHNPLSRYDVIEEKVDMCIV